MRFREIANRLTGLSTPVFGISWNPPVLDITVARRVVVFLEDRRILFAPSELEVPAHCTKSVVEIRHFLTKALFDLDADSELGSHIRAMRAACRKFLAATHDRSDGILVYGTWPGHYESWTFLPAVGELRGVFGIHLAQIAAQHGIDIEDDLASILPGPPEPESDTLS